jgi:hypothetical protein
MALGWYILGAIGVLLLLAVLIIVRRMVREREAAKRRKQAAMAPLAQDTITYAGHS